MGERVVKGFVVPKRGPLFEAELRREAELALGRIWACVKAELSLTEAAEIFAPFKIPKKRGRPRSPENKKRRLERLSDRFSRREIAFELAGKSGHPKNPEAIEKRVQRLRSERRAKRPAKKKLVAPTP
jgi:hypothetical protein